MEIIDFENGSRAAWKSVVLFDLKSIQIKINLKC